MCVYSHVCTHTCACSGQRSTLGVSLNCYMYLFLCFCETISLMTLQCTSLVRLAGQQAPGICLCLPRAVIIGAYADMFYYANIGDPNSGPHACIAALYPPSHLPASSEVYLFPHVWMNTRMYPAAALSPQHLQQPSVRGARETRLASRHISHHFSASCLHNSTG